MFPVPGDALEGIYYAHGRWYVADTGLWFSPNETGQYVYYFNDPVNHPKEAHPLKDALPTECLWGTMDLLNPRDLTCWLFREMKQNLTDPRRQEVRNTVTASHNNVLSGAFILYNSRNLPPIPFVGAYIQAMMIGTGVIQTGVGAYQYYAAYPKFFALVGDRQTWDFKHKILERLGPGITFCSYRACQENVEYSVPGNIHFGFVAREGGYTGLETQLGAGFAEIRDPAHNPNEPDKHRGPYEGRPESFGDTPEDNRTVAFGIRLFDKYAGGRNLTFQAFQLELIQKLGGFSSRTPYPWTVDDNIARNWPYPVGYFNSP